MGGAITSAAISLVGVAWVAWRATGPISLVGVASPVRLAPRPAPRPPGRDVDPVRSSLGGLT